MVRHAHSGTDHIAGDAVVPMAVGFARIVHSTIEEPSDSVPAHRALTVIGVICATLAFWTLAFVATWHALI
jgi:hypothetical protein